MQDLLEQLPALRRYARLLTGDPTRADDLVQDTLERALRKWLLPRQAGKLRPWLLAVMHNLWASQCRATPPMQPWLDDDAALPDTTQHIAQRLDIERALLRLPEQQRAVLLLVTVEDLGYAEVAKVLDIPIGTVMSRLSRARRNLREWMSDSPAVSPGAKAQPATLRIVKG